MFFVSNNQHGEDGGLCHWSRLTTEYQDPPMDWIAFCKAKVRKKEASTEMRLKMAIGKLSWTWNVSGKGGRTLS